MRELEKNISEYNNASSEINGQLRHLLEQIGDRQFSEEEYLALEVKVAELSEQEKAARDAAAVAHERLSDMRAKRVRWDDWEAKRIAVEKKRDVASRLVQLVRGRVFVKFLAEGHLRDMATDASARLGSLTGQRYALETSGESDFIIRDDFNRG